MVFKRALLYVVLMSASVLAGAPVIAREGVEVGKESAFANLVPAAEVEQSARQQYAQMLKEAASKNALGPDDHPQVQRLRRISKELIPFALQWNPRAKDWAWEVNSIGSNQINAFCMPGGKIAFYTGILNRLKLTDDEVAMVMGHEIALRTAASMPVSAWASLWRPMASPKLAARSRRRHLVSTPI
jgi:Zn-dependent protease with chaperone function